LAIVAAAGLDYAQKFFHPPSASGIVALFLVDHFNKNKIDGFSLQKKSERI
jgi:hypothetical protein